MEHQDLSAQVFKVITAKNQAKLSELLLNLSVLLQSQQSIPEHTTYVEEVERLMIKIDKVNSLSQTTKNIAAAFTPKQPAAQQETIEDKSKD